MRDKLALGGSVITAVAASLCCIGPLVAVLIGASTLGLSATLGPLRPYLLGLTALLLATAFYLTYRKRGLECEDGECHVKPASRASKLMLWLATALTVAFATFPYYSGAILSASAGSQEPADSFIAGDATRGKDASAVIAVSGMTCDSCEIEIESALAKVPGVKSADASYEKAQATVVYDSTRTNLDAIQAAISSTGYKAGDAVSQKAASPEPAVESSQPQASAASESQQTQPSQSAQPKRATAIIRVEGMTCGGCAKSVEIALGKLKGISSARVSFEKKQARVTYDSQIVTLDQIKAAIEATGFKIGAASQSGAKQSASVKQTERNAAVAVLESLDGLKDQFQRDGGKVRLIAILSPT